MSCVYLYERCFQSITVRGITCVLCSDVIFDVLCSGGSLHIVYLTFWDVVFVCVENDVCEDGICSVYICWWLNVRENILCVCSE